ncbi:DUF3775 domain-containing protein [Cupriavidus necator]
MTPHLRKTIDELVRLDAQYQAEATARHPNGITMSFGGKDTDKELQQLAEVFKRGPNPTLQVLEGLPKYELSYIMALTWFGRGDGIAEPGATFESVLDYARQQCDSRSAGYVASKPLSKYLPAGLKRMGL